MRSMAVKYDVWEGTGRDSVPRCNEYGCGTCSRVVLYKT
jgi:hypothetical protein